MTLSFNAALEEEHHYHMSTPIITANNLDPKSILNLNQTPIKLHKKTLIELMQVLKPKNPFALRREYPLPWHTIKEIVIILSTLDESFLEPLKPNTNVFREEHGLHENRLGGKTQRTAW